MKNLVNLGILILIITIYSCSEDDDPIIEETGIVTTDDLIDTHTGEINGKSTLTRYPSSISFEIETNNLIPGHVYQVMCAIFNKPENCVGPCDRDDFDNNNTAVEATSFVMAGKVASRSTETFKGSLKINETSYDWLPTTISQDKWGGLQKPQTATIGLLLRSQGPEQSGLGSVQRNTFRQACSFVTYGLYDSGSRVPEEIGECAYIRNSQHVAR